MTYRLDPHPVDALADLLKPRLKALGFRKSRLTWHRPGEEAVSVIALERGRWGGCQFDAHIGASFGFLTSSARPPYYQCDAQSSWQKQLLQPERKSLQKEFDRIDLIQSRGVGAQSTSKEHERLFALGPAPVDPSEWKELPEIALKFAIDVLLPLLDEISTMQGLRRLKAQGPVAHDSFFHSVVVTKPLSEKI